MPQAEAGSERPDYGNWVSARLLYIFGGAGILFLGLSFLEPASIIGTIVSLIIFGYFAYARYEFSPHGGGVQDKVRGLVLGKLEWDGKGQILDIGCGNGPLAIDAAKMFTGAKVTGIDSWGNMWEYSKATCEKNAECERVGGRVSFQKADAAALPFKDGTFDAAVSNLVFHEVRSAKDKREVVREALRVVRKGGSFSFQDLFKIRSEYGEIESLLQTMRSWGIEEVAFVDTSASSFIPRALRLPFMVGTIGIIHGRK